MRHRYLYYVEAHPRLSDYDFDQMHRYFLALYPGSAVLNSVGSDCPEDYPLYIVRGCRPLSHERRIVKAGVI